MEPGIQLIDGGMGTQLIARGLRPGDCPERWLTDRPADVAEVHRAYASAGCRWITTATFGVHPLALARHGEADRAAEFAAAAVRLARAAGPDVRVLGDLGPFGGFLEPVGDADPAEVDEGFRRVAGAMAAEGVDGWVVETMADPAEAALAVGAARAAATAAGKPDQPVLATFAYQRAGEGFRTMMGTDPAAAVRAMADAGADVVGANCGTDLALDDYLRLADALLEAADGLPVVVQANAGPPVATSDGSVAYGVGPLEYGAFALQLAGVGVRWIGGCCGTTPEHLREAHRTLAAAGLVPD